jgi:integrase
MNAKNKLRQSVTMPQQLIELCLEYGIDKADGALYALGKGKRFNTRPNSVNMLRWRFNKVRDRLGMSKGYKFYSSKHTGASKAHLSGKISLRELMDQLRHTKMEATQHYVKKHIGIINPRVRDCFPSPV